MTLLTGWNKRSTDRQVDGYPGIKRFRSKQRLDVLQRFRSPATQEQYGGSQQQRLVPKRAVSVIDLLRQRQDGAAIVLIHQIIAGFLERRPTRTRKNVKFNLL